MSQQLSELQIDTLTVTQRLDLIGRLWDSLPDPVAMPQWHHDELDRRLEAADAAPGAGIPWEQVKARLRQRP